LFGVPEQFGEGGVRFGYAFLQLFEEGLTESEEEPITIRDEDVVEEFAEFWIFGSGRVLINATEEVGIGPPFVTNEFVQQRSRGRGKHGRKIAERPRG